MLRAGYYTPVSRHEERFVDAMTPVPDRGCSSRSSRLLILAIVLLSSACATVPEVESRLGSLQFRSNMYIVRPGDSVASIAYRFNLTPQEIIALNPGIETHLYSGLGVNVRRQGSPRTAVARADRDATERTGRQSRRGERGSGTTLLPEAERVTVTPAPSRPPLEPQAAAPRQPVSTAERWRPEPLVPAEAPVSHSREADARAAAEWRREEARRRLDRLDAPLVAESDVLARADDDVWRTEDSWPREEVIEDDFDDLLDANRQAFEGSGFDSTRGVEGTQARADTGARSSNAIEAGNAIGTGSGAGQWQWPTDGTVARGFDPRRTGGHGVDIAGAPGQDVRASLDGTVVYAGRDLSGGGNLVIVRHDDQLMTTYSHADKLFVTEDDQVRAGDPIASLGWNADSESVLSFEIRRDGSPLDPLAFLPARNFR